MTRKAAAAGIRKTSMKGAKQWLKTKPIKGGVRLVSVTFRQVAQPTS